MEDIFVGRTASFEDLKDRWKQLQPPIRIFGIYGPKSIGKTRYVKEFLTSLQTDSGSTQLVVTLDFRFIKSFKQYMETLAHSLELSCQTIREVTQALRNRKDGVILHHDHQELARVVSREGERLSDASIQESLWDVIYQNLLQNLLQNHHNNNVRLIISSTDVFKFAQFRTLVWDQTLGRLTEEESLELLGQVWAPAGRGEESRRHIVRLCDGVPSAIINVGE